MEFNFLNKEIIIRDKKDYEIGDRIEFVTEGIGRGIGRNDFNLRRGTIISKRNGSYAVVGKNKNSFINKKQIIKKITDIQEGKGFIFKCCECGNLMYPDELVEEGLKLLCSKCKSGKVQALETLGD